MRQRFAIRHDEISKEYELHPCDVFAAVAGIVVFVYNMRKIINVPVDFIRRLRWDKTSIEMLVCAIMIKRKYQNSVLYDLRVTSVMRSFGVSHKKAKKLIEAFKKSEFFIYNPTKNCIFAKTFKSGTRYIYGHKKKYVAFADYCRKMQFEDTINLREVVRELRNILIICAINATEYSGDNLKVGGKTTNYSVTKHPVRVAMPQAKLGYIIGLGRSSACRYVHRLIDDKRIGKSGIVAKCVVPFLSDETEREYKRQHPGQKYVVWHDTKHCCYSAWVIYGNSYFVSNRKDSDAFKHVIYNYKRGTNIEPTTSSELDGGRSWDRF